MLPILPLRIVPLKQHHWKIGIGLWLGLCLSLGAASAQNLAQNPGFEAGNTSGWSAFGAATISLQTTQVHSGTYAVVVGNRSANWHGISQSLAGKVAAGQTGNISMWVRLVSGGSQTVQLTVKKTDGNGDAYANVASSLVAASGWTQLSGQYALTISGTLTSLTMYVEMPSSSTAAFFVDDLVVEVPTVSTETTVNWNQQFQRIDGFGASSAWRSTWTTPQADLFFSTNTGAGLSLLRTRIAPGATTVENTIMQMAQARGARVWSTPWSPATTFKTTNASGVISVNGGGFNGNPANYQAYASQLAGYVASMKNTYGVNLHALSVQNEPDMNTTSYESCVWTAQQIRDFVPYLSTALTASNVAATKIMLPESIHWSSNPGLYTTAMADLTVSNLVSIIANHNYDGPNSQTGATTTPAELNSYGKALWQTEVSTTDTFDGSITNALYWAGRVHLFLTAAQANAYHYWWLLVNNGSSDNGALCDLSGNPAKRLYALGQFSRFVRPGFYRIGVTNGGPLQISAYKDPNSLAFAIVVINSTTTNVAQAFNLSGFNPTTVTPWLTSAAVSLAAQTAVAVSGNSFTNIIPAQSIVTFVGQAVPANSAPTDLVLSNSTVGENQSAGATVGAFSSTDPDAGNTFTYALVNGAGSTDNGGFTITGSNLLTASSFDFETKSSYAIRIRATDQGGLHFEEAFTITVTNLNETPTDLTLANSTLGENQAPGTTLGMLSTSDPDAGNTFTYTLVGGAGSADNSSFSITGNNVLTAASFNYEAKNNFSLRLRSTDQGGLSIDRVFNVTVTNVNEAPTFAPVSDPVIGAGEVFSVTNSASDPDLPAQTFTFSLLGGPTNATLDSSSGVFVWRPLVAQANTTNLVIVTVADDGLPPLNDTNSFTLVVSPLVLPTLTMTGFSNDVVNLEITGAAGPDYTLLASTNFVSWQPLLTTNPSVMPVRLVTTNSAAPRRYYRLQLGP